MKDIRGMNESIGKDRDDSCINYRYALDIY